MILEELYLMIKETLDIIGKQKLVIGVQEQRIEELEKKVNELWTSR